MNKIPLVDLKVQYKSIKEDIDRAIGTVVDKTDFIMGEEVKIFEDQFAKYIGVKHAVGLSSGTDALHLALLAIGIKEGDEIILPSHTFTATAEVICWIGAKPVFIDIDPDTFNIDISKIKINITKRTKAIIPVHLYGRPAVMDQIMAIAGRYRLSVVEDCAQAHGAIYNGEKVGTIGDIGCFSFYPGKNLGAYGDAGAITTNNDQFAQKVKLLRNHGRKEKYAHLVVGYGNRLDTIQASVLSAKLRHLSKWNRKRQGIAAFYSAELSGVKGLTVPLEEKGITSVYHLYVIRAKNRDRLREYLKLKGIETGIHYPIPLHLQRAYQYLNYHKGDLPVTEKAVEEILSLPIFPEMTLVQLKFISKCIRDFYC